MTEDDGYKDGVRDGKISAHEKRITDLEDNHKNLTTWARGVAVALFGAIAAQWAQLAGLWK